MIIISNCLNTRNLCMHSSLYEIHSLPKTTLTPLNTLCAGLTKLITRTATRGTCCGGCGRPPSCCRWIIYSRSAARPLTGIYNIYTISTPYLQYLHDIFTAIIFLMMLARCVTRPSTGTSTTLCRWHFIRGNSKRNNKGKKNCIMHTMMAHVYYFLHCCKPMPMLQCCL